jgi:hypothetical protein
MSWESTVESAVRLSSAGKDMCTQAEDIVGIRYQSIASEASEDIKDSARISESTVITRSYDL